MPNIVYTVTERIEMVRQHEQGLSYRRIVDHFAASYPKRPIPSTSTVQKIVQKFRKTGNLDPSLIKITQPSKQLTEETKLNICLTVEEGVNKPLSKIAKEFDISRTSVHKIIKNHNKRKLQQRAMNYGLKNHKKHQRQQTPPPPTHQTQRSNSSDENGDLIVGPDDIKKIFFDHKNEIDVVNSSSSSSSSSSSPLHYSLWSYLKDRLYSEGRMAELDTLWNRVTNVLEELDGEIISKINRALDITPLIKEKICSDDNSSEPERS